MGLAEEVPHEAAARSAGVGGVYHEASVIAWTGAPADRSFIQVRRIDE